MTVPHLARFQDFHVLILATNLDHLSNTHLHYPQPFQAIFGPCLQTTTHYFLIFSVAYLTTVLVIEIRSLQRRVLR